MTEDSLSRPSTTVSIVRPVTLINHLKYLLLAMRPRQWTKNGIVFMAFLFSVERFWRPGEIDTWDHLVLRAAATAGIFCLVSGAEYLVNDVRDREADRLHPRKSRRVIAAGLLAPRAAVTYALLFWLLGSIGAFLIDPRTGAVVVGYIALMLAYSYYLKFEVILDVMAIAAGFVLRAMAGAYAIDVPISPWLYVVTALGALFIAVTKRRAEVGLLQEEAAGHRSTLLHYTPALLDQLTAMVTSSTIIAYALYTFTAEGLPANHTMMLTIPFVAYGIFRYLFLALSQGEGGSPEELILRDVPLIVTVLGWVLTSMAVLIAFR
jgi:4-hydroxybenzoate polyprenyltransferase